ncbi:hypothetical protein [Anabaena subtropica]|uniref:Secreted protein n=1 Tax=Anabaena subtropica FACHB-260 TaxID=2692884 RepID=A0ABR8CJD7_9NOST|nr:hypothetical protein [Anabaena subtropica]MBD2342643.1 hypothetical protein [Anabaena subtropica FACHB-260]
MVKAIACLRHALAFVVPPLCETLRERNDRLPERSPTVGRSPSPLAGGYAIAQPNARGQNQVSGGISRLVCTP